MAPLDLITLKQESSEFKEEQHSILEPLLAYNSAPLMIRHLKTLHKGKRVLSFLLEEKSAAPHVEQKQLCSQSIEKRSLS